MTDFLAASICMVLSWLIRQVESGGEIDNEAGMKKLKQEQGGQKNSQCKELKPNLTSR
jgi:hypothetical protein